MSQSEPLEHVRLALVALNKDTATMLEPCTLGQVYQLRVLLQDALNNVIRYYEARHRQVTP